MYYVVKEAIKKQIKEGLLTPGDFLPTEGELCETYQVSRVTVRRAIEELVEEGILKRDHGKTATVAPKSIPRSLNRLGGLHEELTKAGIKCSSYLLNAKETEADEKLSDSMGIEVGTPLYRIERLRYADGNPISHQILYIIKELCPELEFSALTSTSLYELFEKQYHLNIDYALQSISSTLSSYKQAALLELPERTCMLCVKRTTYLKNKQCIEYSESYYVANRYNLSMTLQR